MKNENLFDQHKEDAVLRPSLNQKSFLMNGLQNTPVHEKHGFDKLYWAVGQINMTTYKMCLRAIKLKQYRRLEEDLLKLTGLPF